MHSKYSGFVSEERRPSMGKFVAVFKASILAAEEELELLVYYTQ